MPLFALVGKRLLMYTAVLTASAQYCEGNWASSSMVLAMVIMVQLSGKHTRKAVGKGPVSRAELPMHLIHSDVCGPLPPSYSCAVFMVSFINDHTCYAHAYFMHAKSEAIAK